MGASVIWRMLTLSREIHWGCPYQLSMPSELMMMIMLLNLSFAELMKLTIEAVHNSDLGRYYLFSCMANLYNVKTNSWRIINNDDEVRGSICQSWVMTQGRGEGERSWESFWLRAKPHSLAYITVSCAHSITISITHRGSGGLGGRQHQRTPGGSIKLFQTITQTASHQDYSQHQHHTGGVVGGNTQSHF